MNLVVVVGNLTRDPERKQIREDLVAAEFGLAVNEPPRKNRPDEKIVHFFDCVVFGKMAETLVEYKRKGDPILVQGRLVQERWDDKNTGRAREKVKIVSERIQFIGTKKSKAAAGPDDDGEREREEPADESAERIPF